MVDTLALGASGSNPMRVRVSPTAQEKNIPEGDFSFVARGSELLHFRERREKRSAVVRVRATTSWGRGNLVASANRLSVTESLPQHKKRTSPKGIFLLWREEVNCFTSERKEHRPK